LESLYLVISSLSVNILDSTRNWRVLNVLIVELTEWLERRKEGEGFLDVGVTLSVSGWRGKNPD